jgi:hypothetical protein
MDAKLRRHRRQFVTHGLELTEFGEVSLFVPFNMPLRHLRLYSLAENGLPVSCILLEPPDGSAVSKEATERAFITRFGQAIPVDGKEIAFTAILPPGPITIDNEGVFWCTAPLEGIFWDYVFDGDEGPGYYPFSEMDGSRIPLQIEPD